MEVVLVGRRVDACVMVVAGTDGSSVLISTTPDSLSVPQTDGLVYCVPTPGSVCTLANVIILVGYILVY